MVIYITYKEKNGSTVVNTYANSAEVPWEGVYAARLAMAREGGTVSISEGEGSPDAQQGRSYAESSYKRDVYNEIKPMITDESGTLREPKTDAERVALQRAKNAGLIQEITIQEQRNEIIYNRQEIPQDLQNGMSYNNRAEKGSGIAYYYGKAGTGVVSAFDPNTMIMTNTIPGGTFMPSDYQEREYFLIGKMPDILKEGPALTESDFQRDNLGSTVLTFSEFGKGFGRIILQTPEMIVNTPSFIYSTITDPGGTLNSFMEQGQAFGQKLRTNPASAAGEVAGFYVGGKAIGIAAEGAYSRISSVVNARKVNYQYSFDATKIIDFATYQVGLSVGKVAQIDRGTMLDRFLGKSPVKNEAGVKIQSLYYTTKNKVLMGVQKIEVTRKGSQTPDIYMGVTKTTSKFSGETALSTTYGKMAPKGSKTVQRYTSFDISRKIMSRQFSPQVVDVGGKMIAVDAFDLYASKGVSFRNPITSRGINKNVAGVYRYAGEKGIKAITDKTGFEGGILEKTTKPSYSSDVYGKNGLVAKIEPIKELKKPQTNQFSNLAKPINRMGKSAAKSSLEKDMITRPVNMPMVGISTASLVFSNSMDRISSTRQKNDMGVSLFRNPYEGQSQKLKTREILDLGQERRTVRDFKITTITDIGQGYDTPTRLKETPFFKPPTPTPITPTKIGTPFFSFGQPGYFDIKERKSGEKGMGMFTQYTANIAGIFTGAKRSRKKTFSGLEFRGL
jgi:hypothetical protein